MHLPPGNPLSRAIHGEAAEWTTETHLLALIADIGSVANWQRTKDGHTGKNPPKGLPRPGQPVVVDRPELSREEAQAMFEQHWTPSPKKRAAKKRR